MKKNILLLFCLVPVLCSYSQIPTFEINSPDYTEIKNNAGDDLQERVNAAKELIWVLPSNLENTKAKVEFWITSMETIINYFNSIGITVRRIYTPFTHAYIPGFTVEMPDQVADNNFLLSLSRKHFYQFSSIIVIPRVYFASNGWGALSIDLKFIDIYQNTSYTRTLKFASLKKSISKELPQTYLYNENYEYIRPGYTTNWTESIFKEYAQKTGLETFEGIYQIENQRYFVKKHNHLYYLVACGKAYLYLEGDIKGILTPTATPNVFLGGWNDGSQEDPYRNSTYAFTDIGVEFQSGSHRRMLIKVWPTSEDDLLNSSNTWTGTAWSLKNGYIVTNHHVVENAKSIHINVANNKYEAMVKAVDKTNDLAILYVDELKKQDIPYSVKNSMCSVGEKCFVLGYPMSSELGHEIKVTDGIISSRVGYQDNVALYQISAPVQPGNSGCPMFDESGNIAGVVNSGVPSADNVGYAIKLSYLRTLLENYDWLNLLPDGKEVESLGTLTEKVNTLKQYVYLVECSN